MDTMPARAGVVTAKQLVGALASFALMFSIGLALIGDRAGAGPWTGGAAAEHVGCLEIGGCESD